MVRHAREPQVVRHQLQPGDVFQTAVTWDAAQPTSDGELAKVVGLERARDDLLRVINTLRAHIGDREKES
jgi:hypothetical protein